MPVACTVSYENHWGSPTLTLLNVLGVLGVLNVLNVLYVLHGRIVGLLGLVCFSIHLDISLCEPDRV